MHVKERYRGCLLGLAAGDAVGTTLEFSAPALVLKPLTDMVGGGPFHLKPGQWTDDTSMALCLASSLVEKGYDPADQMQHYLRWYREGYLSSTGRCFDIGNTISAALRRFERTGEPYSGSADPYSAGNGSIMRLAPVPLYYAPCPREAIEKSGDSSRTTHGATAAVDACRYLGALIVGAIQGLDKATLLSSHFSPVPAYWEERPLVAEIREVAAGSFKERNPPQIKGSGYAVKSLEAALWAFYHSATFGEGCLMAANLADDADTTAAVYGQLAGAYFGDNGIPAGWRQKVALHDTIVTLAEALERQAR